MQNEIRRWNYTHTHITKLHVINDPPCRQSQISKFSFIQEICKVHQDTQQLSYILGNWNYQVSEKLVVYTCPESKNNACKIHDLEYSLKKIKN